MKGWIAAAVLGVMFMVWQAGRVAFDQRGIRNHNPLNIRENSRTDYDWEGEAIIDNDDEFEVFVSPEYGYRAAARILASYARRGVVTLSDIIHTWAPAEDNNDTAAYLAHVSRVTGINPEQTVKPSDYPALFAVMTQHENGVQPYSMELIRAGVALA